MKKTLSIMGLAGLLLATAVLLREGLPEVIHTLMVAGWGLLWLAPFHLLPVTLDSVSWRILLQIRGVNTRLGYVVWAASVRDAASTIPVFGPGGTVAGARLLILRDVPKTVSVASVIVEGTLTLISQFLFATGAAIIILLRQQEVSRTAVEAILLVLLISAPLLVLLVVAQSRPAPFKWVDRILAKFANERFLPVAAGSPMRLYHELRMIYAGKRRLFYSCLWQLAGLVAGAGEVWLALYLFNQPVGLGSAILLESLGQLIRSVAFVIPAGLGIQEVSFAIFAQMIGLTGTTGLAVSLAKRLREVVFGLPTLASWQWVEGRRILKR